jgi:hypothetical protein
MKAHLPHGENRAKSVHFKEQKKCIAFLKDSNLAQLKGLYLTTFSGLSRELQRNTHGS